MKPIRTYLLVVCVWSLLLLEPAAGGQFRKRPGSTSQSQSPPTTEFLGWNYAKLGYTLSPGEELALLFRNNRTESSTTPIAWRLTTYAGETLAQGKAELNLPPGQTGQVPIPMPPELADGAYFVRYALGGSGSGREQLFYFDFRRPSSDTLLNLNVVALIENMDGEGWVRMMFGPLARYVNVLNEFPTDPTQRVDAVLVIAETLKAGDPRLARLKEYVQQGGKMLLFGKPSAALSELLPIRLTEGKPWLEQPSHLQTLPGGPWADFQPEQGPTHYGVRVSVKEGATSLAQWSDGTPAVVSQALGQGRIVFVGAGSGQVWQLRPALEGADEMGLRLLYWLTGGERGVAAMLERAEQFFKEELKESNSIRDRVFANLKVTPPQDFVVVSRNNVGRFGWLVEEGGLTENISANGVVSGPTTRAFSFGGTQPVVNVGALQETGAEASLAFAVSGDSAPRSTGVRQNWLAKTVTWKYGNGETVRSTLSLGSPGILWEGDSARVELIYRSATHVAYLSPSGIRIVAKGENISPTDLAEGWLLAFTARPDVRDMPQLFVLTRRPESIHLEDGLRLTYSGGGFGALFTSRLWGIRRLAPGETTWWVKEIPQSALTAAQRWDRAFLRYPVDCDEIGWVEGETVALADRYSFRVFKSDWGTEPLILAPLAPVLSLAKTAGAPVQLPLERIDLECATKFGSLEAVRGDTTLVRLPMPPRDHRALTPAEGRMVLQENMDARTAGLGFGQTRAPTGKNEGAGNLHADLAAYDLSGTVPFNEAPCIDVYKWWYTFNALLARPIYSASVRERVDRHFRTRYWETLNFYPHKCFVVQKREPWSGVEYLISFVWPTQTQYGWRNFNDANEASGINAYCFANYARYYGDWATLRANWNFCRRLHEFLPKVNDWASMASGALEYWRVAGLDMVNSEPYGNIAFAYAAANTGHPQDELVGLVHGARSLVTATARFGLQDYLRSITAEGDPWREFRGYYWLMEDGIQASRPLMGGIGMHDTSKGTHHELSLAYKMWIPERIRAYEESLGGGGSSFGRGPSFPDLTQRLFLGWDPKEIFDQAKQSQPRQPMNFNTVKDMYDLGLACIGDIPLFLSDWAPAEYLSGRYDPERLELALNFRSHEGEAFQVRIYSQRAPKEVIVNGKVLMTADGGWRYDAASGWLVFNLEGDDEKRLNIRLGDPVAPLHPYFTKPKL